MDSILEMLQNRLAGDEAARLGERVGTDPSTAQQAIQAALPAIVAALAGETGARRARRVSRGRSRRTTTGASSTTWQVFSRAATRPMVTRF